MNNSEYNIIKQKNRKKTLLFKMENNVVNIYAPARMTMENILDTYEKNKHKFSKQLDKNVNYETQIKLFGKVLNIKVEHSKLLVKPYFEIKNKMFYEYLPINIEKNEIAKYLELWKMATIKKIIFYKIKFFVNKYNFNFDFEKNSINIRKQRTKWGSCTYKNDLFFNYKIIEKKDYIINYLVLHELTHTIEKNHSKNFWNKLSNFCENCELIKKEL